MFYIVDLKTREKLGESVDPIQQEGAETIYLTPTNEELEILNNFGKILKEEKKDGQIEYKVEHSERSLQLQYEKQMEAINKEFDTKIDSFLSKYPKREQETFTQKKFESENVLNGGKSIYIETKAKALGISAKKLAGIIKKKADDFTAMYLQLENEKDVKISELEVRHSKLNK